MMYLPPFFLMLGLALSRNSIAAFALFALSGSAVLGGFSSIVPGLAAELFAAAESPGMSTTMALTVVYCCFVSSLENGGAVSATASLFSGKVKSAAAAQIYAWLSCAAAFFSDFGSTMIIGEIFRSCSDRYHVPREKLALTLALLGGPLAALFPLWIWGIYFSAVLNGLNEIVAWFPKGMSGFSLLLYSLPYAFFPLMCAICVPLTLLTGELPAMRTAWKRANTPTTNEYGQPEKNSGMTLADDSALTYFAGVGAVIVAYVYITAGKNLHSMDYRQVITALAESFLWGTTMLFILPIILRKRNITQCCGLYLAGFRRAVSVTAPMVMSIIYVKVGAELGLWDAIAVKCAPIPGEMLPPAAFLLASSLSWITGSSWGTFGMASAPLLSIARGNTEILPIITGAIISGSLVGDLLSTASGTVSLVSRGAGVDPDAYRQTASQYVVVMAIASTALYSIVSLLSNRP
jgi:Na+/H+ antiporter NhaC